MGVQPPLNLQNFLVVNFLKNILSQPCSFSLNPKLAAEKKVKICTLISHFASASVGNFLPDPYHVFAPGSYLKTSVLKSPWTCPYVRLSVLTYSG